MNNFRTPEAARKKWCPMYRLATRDARLRPDVEDNRQGMCLADDCQDWLWQKGANPTKGYCGFTVERN